MSITAYQVTFPLQPPPAFAGMKADTSNADVETRLAETALDAGYGVVKGTDPTIGQCKLPANTGDVTNSFLGVTLYTPYKEPTGTANRYLADEHVPVLGQGTIWVNVDATSGATITADGPVYCVHSGAQAGKFRGDANSGAATLVPNAKAKSSATEGGIAKIKFNVP